MIKLIIFDLDGVLFSSKDLHYLSLNEALDFFGFEKIPYQDHLQNFDGLSTKQKLQKLGVKEKIQEIYLKKQELTSIFLEKEVHENQNLISIFQKLKKRGYVIHVASNAVRYTVELVLFKLGILKYVDFLCSNQDVVQKKPHPEIYLRCMLKASVGPKETLVLEDSYVGREGVFNSGAHLCEVNSPEDVSFEYILMKIQKANGVKKNWKAKDLNVVIPMAGAGSRFSSAGYTFPKPLIEVKGKPMIQVVVENLGIEADYTYIVRKEHYEKYNLKNMLELITPGCNIVVVESITDGAACTVLLAKDIINTNKQLLIANSDQWIDWDSSDFMYSMQNSSVDGGILYFNSKHPKWSYMKLDDFGLVRMIAEKKVISDLATVGIYFFKKGSDFVKYTEKMISKDIRVNNEFYVAPVYNEGIEDGMKVKPYKVRKMMGLGTPEDLNIFLQENI